MKPRFSGRPADRRTKNPSPPPKAQAGDEDPSAQKGHELREGLGGKRDDHPRMALGRVEPPDAERDRERDHRANHEGSDPANARRCRPCAADDESERIAHRFQLEGGVRNGADEQDGGDERCNEA
jgi:hypothetical protein